MSKELLEAVEKKYVSESVLWLPRCKDIPIASTTPLSPKRVNKLVDGLFGMIDDSSGCVGGSSTSNMAS